MMWDGGHSKEEPMSSIRGRAVRVEAALWIVLGTLAFLAKGNPRLVYPNVLYLFLSLLASSLSTSLAIRSAPDRPWIHALTLLAGFASIAGLQASSGGTESNLWVLYLLPLFTAAILLDGRETAWVAIGACASNAVLYVPSGVPWNNGAAFELALKTGVLAMAAGATWSLSRAERESCARAAVQRREIERLELAVTADAAARERGRDLAEIAAGGASAAHDLSTPLMVVRAYARLHLDRGVEDETLARDLARIENAAVFCGDLVTELLARDRGRAAPRRVSAITETALSLAEPLLRARSLDIRREYSEAPLLVMASNRDLERVLLNILGNAAKAMSAGGRVTVRIARDAAGGTPSARVEIEDDGPGIPAEILPRLFQAFATSAPGLGGVGLGLHMSREAARRLGGTLDAENLPGGGARFTLRLPLVETAPIAADSAVGGLIELIA
jgi:signal transduction histidine kinase